MKPSTFFSLALALIAGVSARPAEMPAIAGMSTPTSTPAFGVRGLPVPPPPSYDSPDNKPRDTHCGDSKESCCDKVNGLCSVLMGDRACPLDSTYCCDFSGNVSNFRLLPDFNLLSLIV